MIRIIVKGASGGLGSGGVSSSRGAIVSTVIELHKNEEMNILVGQSGLNACLKSMSNSDETCSKMTSNDTSVEIPSKSKTHEIHQNRDSLIHSGAGGGGGASYVFLVMKRLIINEVMRRKKI